MATIWTIGYERLLPEQLAAELHAAGVERVIDVRYRPQSRRPGMSKTRLGRHRKSLLLGGDSGAASRPLRILRLLTAVSIVRCDLRPKCASAQLAARPRLQRRARGVCGPDFITRRLNRVAPMRTNSSTHSACHASATKCGHSAGCCAAREIIA